MTTSNSCSHCKSCLWNWAIRLKGDVSLRLATGCPCLVNDLWPPPDEAYCYCHVEVYDEISVHLATAQLSTTSEPWAVLSSAFPSLQTFACYGERFGGIEPHFKDDTARFYLLQSRRCNAQQLTILVMLLDIAKGCPRCSAGHYWKTSAARLAWSAWLEFSTVGPLRDCSTGVSATPAALAHAAPLTQPTQSLCFTLATIRAILTH